MSQDMPDDSQVTTQLAEKISGRNEPSIEAYRMSASFHAAFASAYRQMPLPSSFHNGKIQNICSGDDVQCNLWSRDQENDNLRIALGDQTVERRGGAANIHITMAAFPWLLELSK